MESLQFSVHEVPELADQGINYVVVAICGNWRDGEACNDARQLPQLQRTLRKRFMARLPPAESRH